MLNQNLWNKRGVKNLTVRHTSYVQNASLSPVTVVQEVTARSGGQSVPAVPMSVCRREEEAGGGCVILS